MASFCVVSNIGLLMNREKFNIHAREEIFLPTYRAIGCSLYTSNCSSAFFPSLTCNGFCKPCRWLVCDSKIWSLVDRNGRDMQTHFRSYEFVSPPFLGFQGCYKSQHRLFCNRRTISAFNGNGRERETLAGKVGSHGVRRRKSGSNGVRRRKSLRLRARVWLLFMRLRRFSVWSMLDESGTFLRRNMKRLAIYTSFVVTLGLCYLFLNLSASTSPKMVPYSDLVMSLQNGSVTKVLFEEGSHCIYFNTRSQNPSKTENAEDESPSSVINATNENVEVVANKVIANSTPVELVNVWRNFFKIRASNPEWRYSTRKINEDVSFLLSLMREKDTTYSSAPQPVIKSLRSILVTILSLWIPMSPLMWLLYRQFSSAKSPAKTRRPSSQAVSFDDVEGVDAAKVELMEIISCLQGLENYNKLGAKLPRGVLLIGPPGTGKTLLARAVAGEAGIPFLIVSASEFVELFVGRGAARIRELFNMARKCAPSIIFIDELDAVGGKRGGSFNDERDQTLNQLLTEMDGFESDKKVVVIAATNRPEALDPALCRAGRFSRKVMVGEPDEEGRRKILAVHFREVPLEEEMTIICNLVASITQGFVGADLANIVNEAALLAARRGGETVTREDIVEAIERAKYGINDTHRTSNIISKEIGKLFPWMPSLLGRNDPRQDKLQGPLGYQTLS